jgi:hypothetical protein
MLKERELLLLAVVCNRSEEEEKRLEQVLQEPIDWVWIGGQLLHHRLGGYFYKGLGKHQDKLFKELAVALELLVKAQAQQFKQTIELTQPIFDSFEKIGIRYAALKGHVFNASLYSLGERRSNDSDIMVLEEDLDKVDAVLRESGYIQTNMANNQFVEATRKEKLIQRMNYHDLVPYVKQTGSEWLMYHEFDINFHFDSKSNDISNQVYEMGLHTYERDGYKVRGLRWETHLAHLCVHFYREGSSTIWSAGRRDVVLYKLIDIINTIRQYRNHPDFQQWVSTIRELQLEKAAYYTLYHVMQFYPNLLSKEFVDQLKPDNIEYLYEIAVSGSTQIEKRNVSFVDTAFQWKY